MRNLSLSFISSTKPPFGYIQRTHGRDLLRFQWAISSTNGSDDYQASCAGTHGLLFPLVLSNLHGVQPEYLYHPPLA